MAKKILLCICLLFFAVAVGFGAYRYERLHRSTPVPKGVSEGIVYEVKLTENGFEPSQVRVAVGDIVRFTTTRTASFWPASDLHPTHEIYPEFDPKQPVAATASWQFTFTRAGTWKYHDHLFPLYRGVVVVGDTSSSADSPISLSTSCESGAADNGTCIQQKLAGLANTKGVAAAFDELAKMYDADPAFAGSCHGYTHKIGEVAYEQFSRGHDPQFTQKASYCGYGYYHGFMEALLHSSGNIDEARAFCRGATAQIQNGLGPQIEAACYHGIGHGAVAEGVVTDAQSVRAFLEPGYRVCETVGDTFEHKKICGSGVYNSLALAWMKNQSGGAIDEGDPFATCGAVAQEYFRIACFHQMNTVVSMVTHAHFPKALALVEKVKVDADARAAMDGVATQFGAGVESRQVSGDVIAKACSGAERRLRDVCIRAYVGGLVEGGKPGQEQVVALAFCSNKFLSSSLQDDCYTGFISAIYAWMPYERAGAICVTLPEHVRSQCRKA